MNIMEEFKKRIIENLRNRAKDENWSKERLNYSIQFYEGVFEAYEKGGSKAIAEYINQKMDEISLVRK